MIDIFFSNLLFSWLPLFGAIIMAIWLSFSGNVLALQKESFSALSLPASVQAIYSLILIFGFSSSLSKLLYLPLVLLLLYFINISVKGLGERLTKPELVQAALFIFASTVTQIGGSFGGWESAQKSRSLISGEILALSSTELIIIILSFSLLFVLPYLFDRPFWLLQLFQADERRFKTTKTYRRASVLMQFSVLSAITLSSLFFGALFTSVLLLIPALFALPAIKGIETSLSFSAMLAVISVLLGFSFALLLNVPPVGMIAAWTFILGVVLWTFKRI